MANFISEDNIEQAAIAKLVSEKGYTSLNCMTDRPEVLPDGSGRENKKQVVLPNVVFASLKKLNPQVPDFCLEKVAEELCKTPSSVDLMQVNYISSTTFLCERDCFVT